MVRPIAAKNTDITMYPIRELRKTDISFFSRANISSG
jgi:hypothetical protein